MLEMVLFSGAVWATSFEISKKMFCKNFLSWKNLNQGFGFMQYIFEKEYIFYEEKCNTTEVIERCENNCADDLFESCLESCYEPYICEEAKNYYNFIFAVFTLG